MKAGFSLRKRAQAVFAEGRWVRFGAIPEAFTAARIGHSRAARSIFAGLIVTLACAIPLARNGWFYFQDDFQTSLLPVFLEIGSNIRNGEFHWLSAGTWFGGNLAGEYQYGALNPVNLLLFAVMSEFGDLRAAASFFVLFHIFVLASGLAFLARLMGCRFAASVLAALIGCTSSWLLYWGAATWIPALTAMAWMSWAAAFLILTFRSRIWMPAAALFCSLTVLSGWVPGDIALAVFAAIAIGYGLRTGAPRRPLWRVAIALAAGIGLAMPALACAYGHLEMAARTIEPLDSVWQVRPEHLLFWSIPTHFGIWTAHGQVNVPLGVPILYGSWVCLAGLLRAWDRKLWRDHHVRLLLLVILASAALSMMPSVWHLRWPFKFLAYFHAGLALLTAVLISRMPSGSGAPFGLPFRTLLVILGTLYVLTLMMLPEYWRLHLSGALVLLFAVLCSLAVFRVRAGLLAHGLALGHLAVLILFIWPSWPSNGMTGWTPPADMAEFKASGGEHGAGKGRVQARGRTLALYRFPYDMDGRFAGPDPGRAFWLELAPGNTGLLYRGGETINGYSPFMPKGLTKALCFEYMSAVCRQFSSSRLFAPGYEGRSLVDLLGITVIRAQNGPLADDLLQHMPEDWVIEQGGKAAAVIRLRARIVAPLVTEAPEGVRLELLEHSPDFLKFSLAASPQSAGGRLMLAVPWHPGWQARLNGLALEVRPVANLVPAIQLPAGASGELSVSFRPRGLEFGLGLAGLSFLVLVLCMWRPGRRRRSILK